MRRDLSHEHVIDVALHCALAAGFVGILMAGLALQSLGPRSWHAAA